jgi:putative nucleotidyltransferase with HDIG domain
MALVESHAADSVRLATVRERLRSLIERRELPSLPVAVTKALRMLEDPNVNVRHLCRVLYDDGALAARIIAISRSPYYGQRTLPSTLQAAVQVMGLRDLRNIIVSSVTHSLFKSAGMLADALWSHSLAVALGARLLSARLGEIDPEQAFLTGLLHDVGQMILLHGDRDGYSQLVAEACNSNGQMVDEEQKYYGTDHAELGAVLLESWNFDMPIRTAVHVHHSDQKDIDPRSLAAITIIADFVAFRGGLGFGAEPAVPAREIMHSFTFDNAGSLGAAVAQLRQSFNTESAFLRSG